MRCLSLVMLVLACSSLTGIHCFGEDWKPIERHLPPAGIEIDAADRHQLEESLKRIESRYADFRKKATGESEPLLVDVEIYLKAVRFALEENEFFSPRDVESAGQLLATAGERLDALNAGKPAWPAARGLVVRGYRSQIDESVQPYGLEIPEGLDLARQVPLYVWLHGRNDKLCDLQFIAERSRKVGPIQPHDAIVLHPFGRSCLGWKSTAEIDVLEAIESVASRYPIDRRRIVLTGFSMGGAGAWHIGAHYTDRFAAVHAGAGFVDVLRYQKLKPEQYPPAIVQTMWSVYDVPKYVRNLFNVPVVAYSGEHDKQKDAADFMAEAFSAEGRTLDHRIGPGMGHKYHPDSLRQVLQRLHEAAERGQDPAPAHVSLQTRTLRYNRMHWVEILGLDAHWQDSRVDAGFTDAGELQVTTGNVSSLKLSPPLAWSRLTIDGQEFGGGTKPVALEKTGGRWQTFDPEVSHPPRKRPGLQGPIDDVLLAAFLVVLPSETSTPQVDRWVDFELEHFRRRWKNVYRAALREVRDVDVSDDDLTRFHLICWGDPKSNSILRKVANQLLLTWKEGDVVCGSRRFSATSHVPLAIAPNPLNAAKYLVINSGPTHREAHDRTNSLQNPQLGDWAIIDITAPPTAQSPGKVVLSGLFDEQWQSPEEVSGK